MLSHKVANSSSQHLINNFIKVIALFPENMFTEIHNSVKSSFIPDSAESDLIEKLYQQMSIQKKLSKS